MHKKFTPTFGMKNRHIQTLYASFFRKNPQPKVTTKRFTLKDGDFLDAHWHYTNNSNPNTPIVILFHGLTGSYKSHYIRGMMTSFAENGYNCVLMSFRGASLEINKHARSYHSGETNDALEFVRFIQSSHPLATLYAVGYSLGGNVLLKLLGEMKFHSPFKAAISVSAPMQLDICANVVNKGFSRFYQRNLMKPLKTALYKKYTKHNLESVLNYKQNDIKHIKSFWEFDEIYTAPIHGFTSAKDYYKKCSSKQFLKDIHTPTLIIHASDDPFMNDSILPSKDEMSDFVILEVSKNGGHVGFVEGSIFKPKYWLEDRIIKFFDSL